MTKVIKCMEFTLMQMRGNMRLVLAGFKIFFSTLLFRCFINVSKRTVFIFMSSVP